MNQDIPIVINSFNQLTYLHNLIRKLELRGYENIIILDQASTYIPLNDYYEQIQRKYCVIKLRYNNGPHWFFMSQYFKALPDFFIYTDPDIDLPDGVPPDFVAHMKSILVEHNLTKLGLALDVSDVEALIPATLSIAGNSYTIASWEQQFWQTRLEDSTNEIYEAAVDTTFAIYSREKLRGSIDVLRSKGKFDCMSQGGSARLAGQYTATHLPWMRNDILSSEELDFYVSTRGNIHDY